MGEGGYIGLNQGSNAQANAPTPRSVNSALERIEKRLAGSAEIVDKLRSIADRLHGAEPPAISTQGVRPVVGCCLVTFAHDQADGFGELTAAIWTQITRIESALG